MEIVLKENSSSMYFPAMLRLRRLSAVTAMTMLITTQRTCVPTTASSKQSDSPVGSCKRLFITDGACSLPGDSLLFRPPSQLRPLAVRLYVINVWTADE